MFEKLLSHFLFYLSLFKITNIFDVIALIYYSIFIVIPIILLLFIFLTFLFKKQKYWPRYLIFLSLLSSFILLGIDSYARYYEPYNLKIRTYHWKKEKISSLKIVHLSDIQTDRIDQYEEKVFAKVKNLNPDIVLVTGDFLQPYYQEEVPKLRKLFNSLSIPGGIFAVRGDVEDLSHLKLYAKNTAMEVLDNEVKSWQYKKQTIHLGGLSNPDSRSGHPDVYRSLKEKKQPGDLTLIMGHSPDYIATVPQEIPIDLAFAGHTHGGQVRLPFWGPIITFSRLPREYTYGFFPYQHFNVSVSAGIGLEHYKNAPLIRFNCPPEIVEIIIN